MKKTLSETAIVVSDYLELFELQNTILEMVAGNTPQQEILDTLCRMQEKLVPNSVATIMRLGEKGTLQLVSAPSLDQEACRELEGLVPGEQNGSCASVIYHKAPQFVSCIHNDERWKEALDFAEKYHLQACWSVPVELDGKVVGTFALSSFKERKPSPFEKMLLSIGARVVSIVFKREQHFEKLKHLAFHDSLTGLVNRVLLEERIAHMINRAERMPGSAALLFLDLDRFKFLNDTYGHAAGDHILIEVGRRLQGALRKGDTIARFGGDEFVLLFEGNEDRNDIQHKAESILDLFKDSFSHEGHSFRIFASIGIAIFPDDGHDAATLLKHADTAMYQAKQTQEHIRFYASEMSEQTRSSLVLEKELYEALELGQFEVYYQPILGSDTMEIISAEALIRWHHPEQGLVMPGDFIPFAEETGMIAKIDKWVLETVIASLRRWHQNPQNRIVPVSVNISGRHINEQDVTKLLETLNRSSLARDYIGLELTESYLMQFASETIVQLERLKHAGVKLSMDDFGTGYSSLGYLKRFKIDTLKIDQLLVRDIVEDQDDRTIADAIVKMGHSLGLKIIAEGVETRAQLETLKAFRCDALQGFYFDRALPVERFEDKY
ncbi:MAG TPA: EAL domain-containing protein, partial [Sulfuricurvum sp.]|nr:EAL domain-containing protein [Sulfuricurvum sp.]